MAMSAVAVVLAVAWTLFATEEIEVGAAYTPAARGHETDTPRTERPVQSSLQSPMRRPGVSVVAAGDLSCDPANEMFRGGHGSPRWCRAEDTAALIDAIDPDVVIPLGDTQYDTGQLHDFRASYDRHWGKQLRRTRPVVGNHEYGASPDADGYFTYFGDRAGRRGRGWYSYRLGSWHVVALNSNCLLVACGPGSAQYRWLDRDLRTSRAACTLVAMHHPRFSSGPHGDDPDLQLLRPMWRLLYDRGAEVVLGAHDHIYERFAPMDPRGRKDQARGVRQFTAGTGGAEHYWIEQVRYASQVREVDTFGVLNLTLLDGSYRWRFAPVAGSTFSDQGSDGCHRPPA